MQKSIHRRKEKENSDTKIRLSVLKFGIPTILALLSTSAYHLADAWFVSNLDATAGAAIGVAFTLQALFQAVGFTFGTGGGCLVSASLGASRAKEASAYASCALIGAFATGCTILGIGLLLLHPLVRLLGADESIFSASIIYIRNLLPASPFLCGSVALAQLLRAKGNPWKAAIGFSVGNLLNILLDPLFIFGLNMGIGGASMATLVGQAAGFLLLLFLGQGRCSSTHFFRLRLKGECFWQKEKSLLLYGIPSLARQGFLALSALLMNRIAAQDGVDAVAAMSVVNRLFLLGFAFCAGTAQGATPLIAYHFGGGRRREVGCVLRASLLFSSAMMLLLSLPLLLFTPEIISLFHRERGILEIGSRALQAQAAVFPLHGVITCTTLALQAVGRKGRSLFLASARQGIFLLPLLKWIPAIFGSAYFIYAQPIADGLTFLLTLPFLIHFLREMSVRHHTP